jgi:hypothetical protein
MQVTIADLEEQMTDLQVKEYEDATHETQRTHALKQDLARAERITVSLQEEVAALQAELQAEVNALQNDIDHNSRNHINTGTIVLSVALSKDICDFKEGYHCSSKWVPSNLNCRQR